MKRIINAEYPGQCIECGTEITVDDIIVWDSITSETWCRFCGLPSKGDLPLVT